MFANSPTPKGVSESRLEEVFFFLDFCSSQVYLQKNLERGEPTVPFRLARLTRCFIGLIFLSVLAAAATIAPCNAGFTTCFIPENTPLQLPFTAFAGDAIVTEPGSAVVSDIFRIFNNIVNTGLGTGLGNMAFLYSADDSALPDPSTYSANAVFLSENPSPGSATVYFGNGTNYLLGAPEPQTCGSIGLACVAMAILARRRSKDR